MFIQTDSDSELDLAVTRLDIKSVYCVNLLFFDKMSICKTTEKCKFWLSSTRLGYFSVEYCWENKVVQTKMMMTMTAMMTMMTTIADKD